MVAARPRPILRSRVSEVARTPYSLDPRALLSPAGGGSYVAAKSGEVVVAMALEGGLTKRAH
jgi:hypothetical protein